MVETQDAIHTCEVCGASFHTTTELRIHLIQHDPGKVGERLHREKKTSLDSA
jgi:hypothetical protein